MNNGLPHNIEAEKALLGSVFWSYSSLQKVCEEINGEVFYYSFILCFPWLVASRQ
mgnify:CR=1 FL=1